MKREDIYYTDRQTQVVAERMKVYGETYEEGLAFFRENHNLWGHRMVVLPSSREMVQEALDHWGNIRVMYEPEINYGIYGIYINKRLVYIGKTMNDFSKRFSNYKSEMKRKPNRKIIRMLQQAKEEGKLIEFKPIISSKTLVTCYSDLLEIEKMLIKMYKPIGNVQQ